MLLNPFVNVPDLAPYISARLFVSRKSFLSLVLKNLYDNVPAYAPSISFVYKTYFSLLSYNGLLVLPSINPIFILFL